MAPPSAASVLQELQFAAIGFEAWGTLAGVTELELDDPIALASATPLLVAST
jgi:hypothetical protein